MPSGLTPTTPGRAASASAASSGAPLRSTRTAGLPIQLWRRLSGVPSATIRPRSMITTRSQSSSTSGRMWVESSRVCWRPSSRISSRIEMICRGSRPTVGSSSTSTRGLCRMAVASPTRWRYPLESVPMIWSRTSSSRQRSTATAIAWRASARESPSSRAR